MLDRQFEELCRLGLMTPDEVLSQFEYVKSLLYRWLYMKESAVAALAQINAAIQIVLSEVTPGNLVLAKQTAMRVTNMEVELLVIRNEMTETVEKIASYYTQLSARAQPRKGSIFERDKTPSEVKELISKVSNSLMESILVVRSELDNIILAVNDLKNSLDGYIHTYQGRI